MKKKVIKKIAIGALASILVVGATGCSGGSTTYDNEKDPLIFSIQQTDGVFSPFFSTTAPDGEVAGLTQLGMLANDRDGHYVYGDGQPVIVQDLGISTADEPDADGDYHVTYSFVLKNGIKFSNGSPLTMKDVFFNLYTYLDPAYYGSSTIYSTEIVGLEAYRTQATDENEQQAAGMQFENIAIARLDSLNTAITEIIDEDGDVDTKESFRTKLADRYAAAGDEHILADYDKALELFREELESDYSGSIDQYADLVFTDRNKTEWKGLFSSDVEVFLYNEGYIKWDADAAATANKGESGLDYIVPKTTVDGWAKLSADACKSAAIEYVFNAKVPGGLSEIINYWATADNLFNYIKAVAAEEYYQGQESLTIPNVEGIKFANRTAPYSFKNEKGETKEYAVPQYNSDGSVKEGNEVLTIEIKKVDPKAIWNFSFGVAPMYYYSDKEHIDEFSFENNHFGVEYYSRTFMDDVINAPNKVGVPVGAGAYMAAKASGGTSGVTAGTFKSNNVIYYERNPYYTFGEGPNGTAKIKQVRYQIASNSTMISSVGKGIDFIQPNAKPETKAQLSNSGFGTREIKTNGYGYIGINAKLVPSIYVRRAIMYSINVAGVADYYGSSAEVIYRSMSKESDYYPDDAIAYYPYIRGNVPAAAFEANAKTRMDPDYVDFVTDPANGAVAGQPLSEAKQIEFIKMLVEDKGGYSGGGDSGSTYTNSRGDKLEFKFTVVGSETDHPAYNPLFQAAQFLNYTVKGFKIDVGPDLNGLSKLSTGDLAVWAAAWGSTIDPDMYQVYHMDSKATSVNAWGYPAILRNHDRYDTEYNLLVDLSDLIDEGRENEAFEERFPIYRDALDLVMQLAIELPTYQRTDLFAWDDGKIDSSTFYSNPSSYLGLTSYLQNVSLRVS